MVVLRFCGVVQGVGFRPLVYRTATELGLCGGVYNDHSNAIVLISPKKHLKLRAIKPMRPVRFYPCATALLDPSALESSMRLLDSLLPKLPALASISHIAIYPLYKAFSIIPSLAAIDLSALQATFHILPSYLSTHLSSCSPNHLPNHSPNSPSISPTLPTIPTDSATCNDCLQEIFSPTSRFYHYHLCACTNCGARYSIIDSLPYDRARTSMRDFPLCAACKQDFRTPSSRFYHAQPISCNACSIELRLVDSRTNSVLARDYAGIELCARLLAQGEIVCIKGLGGFALICDSANEQAIAHLRERKNRPHKPFAIMCKNLAQARELADLCKEEEDVLTSLAAPIVLARIKSKAKPTPKPSKAQPSIKIQYLRLNQKGVGLAIQAGIDHNASLPRPCEFIGYMDIDLSTDLTHLLEVYAKLCQGHPIVVGSRLLQGSQVIGRKLLRELTSKTLNTIIKAALHTSFSDAMCGFKFYRADIAALLRQQCSDDPSWFYCAQMLIQAQALGIEIEEIPVRWEDDALGSKVQVAKLARIYLKEIYRLRHLRRAILAHKS